MRALARFTITALFGCSLSAAAAAAAAADSKPGNPDEIKVNDLRDPEVRKYKAILAGLDAFDDGHAMAPKAEAVRFRIEPRAGAGQALLPSARLGGNDGFSLALTVGADGGFSVPRSQAALDAKSELVLNQKRRDYKVTPTVRSPGLPDNVRRLGDLRLECRVNVAIAKEEIPLWIVLTANTVLRTRDWCGFTIDGKLNFTFSHSRPVNGAVLVDGNRSANLETRGRGFDVPISDTRWSDEALIELDLGAEPMLTETDAETPRIGP